MNTKKLLKICAIFGAGLSNACGTAPQVSPCFTRFESNGCFYAPLGSDEVLLRKFQEMDKNICYTPEEHQQIIEWIKRHGGRTASKALAPYEAQMKLVMEKTNGINYNE